MKPLIPSGALNSKGHETNERYHHSHEDDENSENRCAYPHDAHHGASHALRQTPVPPPVSGGHEEETRLHRLPETLQHRQRDGIKFCDTVCLDLTLASLTPIDRAELSARKISLNTPSEIVIAYEENGAFGAVTSTQQKRDHVFGVDVKILSLWKDGLPVAQSKEDAPDVSSVQSVETPDAGLQNADFAPVAEDVESEEPTPDVPALPAETPSATLEDLANEVTPIPPVKGKRNRRAVVAETEPFATAANAEPKKPVTSPYHRDFNGNLTPEAAARAEADTKALEEWVVAHDAWKAAQTAASAVETPKAEATPAAPKSYLADTSQVVDLETGEPLSDADVQAAPAKTETEKAAKPEVPTEPRYCTVLKMKGTQGIFMGAESATDKEAYKNFALVREELRAKYAAEKSGITLNGGWDTGYVLIDGLGCKVGELYIGGLKDLTQGLLPAAELMWHPGSTNSLVHPARIYKGALNTAKALVQAAWTTYSETPNEANRNALNARMLHLENVISEGIDVCYFTPFVGKNVATCAAGCRKEITPTEPTPTPETTPPAATEEPAIEETPLDRAA